MSILIQYAFTTNLTPTTTASGVSGGTITNASLSNCVRASNGYSSDPELQLNPSSGATSMALAVTNSSYCSFNITPDVGKKISLTTLTFNGARGGSGTPRGYGVRSSIDGFASNLSTGDFSTVRPNWSAVSVDLSGAGFQNVTSAITFRLYDYAPNSGNSCEYDDITINGTVADSSFISKVSGVTKTSISKVSGLIAASINKIAGLS